MTRRRLRRCIAAFTALATLVGPVGGALAAAAGHAGRTLALPICSTAGVPIVDEITLPAPRPSDDAPSHDCRKCVLCGAGTADRTLAGPLPAGMPVPACAARAETPAAPAGTQPGAAPTSGRARR